jgi:hypothetical protein
MTARLLALDAILLAFAALSGWAMWEHGYLGIWASILDTSASMQVGVDLVLSAGIAAGFMIRDAREQDLNPWPWVAVTLTAGSFGPLGYLAWREWSRTRAPRPAEARAA